MQLNKFLQTVLIFAKNPNLLTEDKVFAILIYYYFNQAIPLNQMMQNDDVPLPEENYQVSRISINLIATNRSH